MTEIDLPLDPAGRFGSLGEILRGRLAREASGGPGKSEQAAKDFESVLLYKLLEEMDKTIPQSGLLESGLSRQVQGIFWFYLAQELSKQGGLGLWKDIHRQLGAQEADPPPSLEQSL